MSVCRCINLLYQSLYYNLRQSFANLRCVGVISELWFGSEFDPRLAFSPFQWMCGHTLGWWMTAADCIILDHQTAVKNMRPLVIIFSSFFCRAGLPISGRHNLHMINALFLSSHSHSFISVSFSNNERKGGHGHARWSGDGMMALSSRHLATAEKAGSICQSAAMQPSCALFDGFSCWVPRPKGSGLALVKPDRGWNGQSSRPKSCGLGLCNRTVKYYHFLLDLLFEVKEFGIILDCKWLLEPNIDDMLQLKFRNV